MKENNLNKYYVPFDRAKKLRELWFKEYCDSYYNVNGNIIKSWGEIDSPNDISDKSYVNRPLFSQAFDWFREEYNIIGYISFEEIDDSETAYIWNTVEYVPEGKGRGEHIWDFYDTYEEAELACLDKLIEMANEKM